MKFSIHYPAVTELDIIIKDKEAFVPATRCARLLGFSKAHQAVVAVSAKHRNWFNGENGNPTQYLNRDGIIALCENAFAPNKNDILKAILEAMDEALLNSTVEEMIQEADDGYLHRIICNGDARSTSDIAKDYGVPATMLNLYLEAKGLQHWVIKQWITDLSPDLSTRGHDGQNILWSPAGRMLLYFEMRLDGMLPIKNTTPSYCSGDACEENA